MAQTLLLELNSENYSLPSFKKWGIVMKTMKFADFMKVPDGEQMTLKVDSRQGSLLRSRVFGHSGCLIPFEEGLIAKKCKDREITFYRNYHGWAHEIIASDVLPIIEGIAYFQEFSDQLPTLDLVLYRTLMPPETGETKYLLMKDMASGFTRPAVLDLKLGRRTWEIGASAAKTQRHRSKCASATTADLGFRIRGAMWYSRTPHKWDKDGELSVVTRKFGITCDIDQLIDLLFDFFHHKEQIPLVIHKLEVMEQGLRNLREQTGCRMFSTSALIVYDEDNPEEVDCRLLDFEKTYFNIETQAARYNEDLDDCEDGVVTAVQQLILRLQGVLLGRPINC